MTHDQTALDPISRRGLITAAGLVTAGLVVGVASEAKAQPASEMYEETNRGDPDLQPESFSYDPYAVERLIAGQTRAAYQPRIPGFGGQLVVEADRLVGKSRANDRPLITQMLGLFDLPFAQPNGKPYAFCAAGLCYVAASMYARKAGVTDMRIQNLRPFLGELDRHHFYPTPSVHDLYYVAEGKRRWVAKADARGRLAPQPGWLAIFDWPGGKTYEHVGIVRAVDGDVLHTIEFNTSGSNNSDGGAIARRDRSIRQHVLGFVRSDLQTLA